MYISSVNMPSVFPYWGFLFISDKTNALLKSALGGAGISLSVIGGGVGGGDASPAVRSVAEFNPGALYSRGGGGRGGGASQRPMSSLVQSNLLAVQNQALLIHRLLQQGAVVVSQSPTAPSGAIYGPIQTHAAGVGGGLQLMLGGPEVNQPIGGGGSGPAAGLAGASGLAAGLAASVAANQQQQILVMSPGGGSQAYCIPASAPTTTTPATSATTLAELFRRQQGGETSVTQPPNMVGGTVMMMQQQPVPHPPPPPFSSSSLARHELCLSQQGQPISIKTENMMTDVGKASWTQQLDSKGDVHRAKECGGGSGGGGVESWEGEHASVPGANGGVVSQERSAGGGRVGRYIKMEQEGCVSRHLITSDETIVSRSIYRSITNTCHTCGTCVIYFIIIVMIRPMKARKCLTNILPPISIYE